jgi:hypothetical protein
MGGWGAEVLVQLNDFACSSKTPLNSPKSADGFRCCFGVAFGFCRIVSLAMVAFESGAVMAGVAL